MTKGSNKKVVFLSGPAFPPPLLLVAGTLKIFFLRLPYGSIKQEYLFNQKIIIIVATRALFTKSSVAYFAPPP